MRETPMNRDFKGIWIPKEIWLNSSLTLIEKIFLVEIDSLDNEEGCFASNSYFAKFFNLSVSRVSEIINSLSDKRFLSLVIDSERGNKRVIKTLFGKHEDLFGKGEDPIRKTRRPYSEKAMLNNTVSNTINNTDGDLLFKSDKFKQSWQEWVKYRKERRLPKYTETGLKKTFKDLAALCGGDEDTAIQIIDQSISKCWQGLFALKSAPVGKVNGNYHQQVEDAKRSYKLIQE